MVAAAHQWVAPREPPSLEPGDLHVWRVDLRIAPAETGRYLSAAEEGRMEAFADPTRGANWGRSRAALRCLLGRYLGGDPRTLEFHVGAGGKPALEAGPAFNLSHSAHLALLAFRLDCPVGVDVEVDRRQLDELSLASRALGAQTTATLAALADEPRRAEFLRAWTRHEAKLKCDGAGIAGPTGGRPRLAPWLAQLEPGPGAAAAVATAWEPEHLSLWDYSVTP